MQANRSLHELTPASLPKRQRKHQIIGLMKKIEAIIKPFKLEEVRTALDEIGIEEMTVSEVKAFGRQHAHKEVYRGTEFPVASLPEMKIELVLQDSCTDEAVAAIIKGTKTSKSGPGRIFVSQIDDAVHSHVNELAASVD
jgi:nitrogen regulatory protein P-II 1